jgi:hypothetical protein
MINAHIGKKAPMQLSLWQVRTTTVVQDAMRKIAINAMAKCATPGSFFGALDASWHDLA